MDSKNLNSLLYKHSGRFPRNCTKLPCKLKNLKKTDARNIGQQKTHNLWHSAAVGGCHSKLLGALWSHLAAPSQFIGFVAASTVLFQFIAQKCNYISSQTVKCTGKQEKLRKFFCLIYRRNFGSFVGQLLGDFF